MSREPEEELCAGGFVVRDGKVLALRRWNGVWLAPKGHLEPGEAEEEAARREVMEETGLDVILHEFLGETAYTHAEDGRPHNKRVRWFLMTAAPGEVRLEEGMFTAYRWLGPEELDVFTFSAERELARRALEYARLNRK
ncbi:MAG: NUDIX domain-containing protein [Firmicutes bacterium]|nr:NUDIX domain-containing protein [Bacillota bacterium]